jgi:hypothetical protein
MPHVPIVTGIVAPAPMMSNMVAPQPVISPVVTQDTVHHRQVEVKPTMALAWGLFWRMLFLWVFMCGILFLGYMLVRMALGYTSVFGPW